MSKTLLFDKLLSDFNGIKKSNERLPTFMELSKYPHFENVCSNILNFYFDTKQPHKLNDLFLKTLVQCLDNDLSQTITLETINCHREYVTSENKRIDLVIETPDSVIAIENKIFHHLDNKLFLYRDCILKNFSDKKHHKLVVLSIKKENVTDGFESLTYETFFSKLKQNLGFYAVNTNNQYITFLLDFIKTIENHYKMEDTNKEMFDFLLKNTQTIDALINERNQLLNQVNTVVWQLSGMINIEATNVNKWLYQKNTIVFDFTFETFVVSVDVTINYQSVYAELFVRQNINTYENLNALQLLKSNNSFPKSARGYELYNKKINFFDINQAEFTTEIILLLNQIKY